MLRITMIVITSLVLAGCISMSAKDRMARNSCLNYVEPTYDYYYKTLNPVDFDEVFCESAFNE